ncbi:N-acetylmuramoyl-L-alanine amidase [Emticicia sp. 21SJ11W-3]|uniref:N-acetylmuramoyl-L-alanine amidase n=1 Tax=Emticicia sp. 21SJ11W-3 TaxID=2916755 RepID=UPI00209FAAB8|nr:N-acetylmuramoyl-L-alanine amidase [Emticicia sp. 21SJ11W-3]UTA66538.1 N-acetylmuramoyl-L-alanine amidase [Emticicia sp. 21SJ11W-3]
MQLIITAGHNRKDPGAVYAGRNEAEETIRLRNAVTQSLREKGAQVWNDNDAWNLSQTINEIRKISQPGDIICDFHFNAGGPTATGCEVFVADDANATELALAKSLVDTIASTLIIRNRGVKRERDSQHKKLGMMRPLGLNVLVEVCFISNKYDMQQYDTFFDLLVEEITNVLASKF